jgi:CubicO group peptidase (beta-lactamase class C family)
MKLKTGAAETYLNHLISHGSLTANSSLRTMHDPVATTQQEISRRDALRAGAALLGLGWANVPLSAADAPHADPFHDPVYNLIQPRAELIKPLSDAAQGAQARPRMINGVPVTGLPQSLPDLDDSITNIIKKTGIPGVGLCLSKHGQLVCARGYGRASIVGNVVVEPTMPATIMSCSKPLTVTAALTLVRDGKLRLDDLAFPILKDAPILARGQTFDQRQSKITVRQLMNHTSGLFNAVEVLIDARRFQNLAQKGRIQLIHGRIGQNDLVRVGMGQKLLFNPGTKFAYSGQAMQVLGRIVEKIGGLRLDRYIRRFVCGPLSMRSYYVGSYLNDDQYHRFYKPNRETLYTMFPTIYDKDKKRYHVPPDDSNKYVAWGAADACGWGSMSAIDVLRWITFFCDLIGPDVTREALERPSVVNDKGEQVKGGAGLGWFVTNPNRKGRVGFNHVGAWAGERCFAECRAGGGSVALLVNSEDEPNLHQLNQTARKYVDKLKAPPPEAPDWKDYGFPPPAFRG